MRCSISATPNSELWDFRLNATRIAVAFSDLRSSLASHITSESFLQLESCTSILVGFWVSGLHSKPPSSLRNSGLMESSWAPLLGWVCMHQFLPLSRLVFNPLLLIYSWFDSRQCYFLFPYYWGLTIFCGLLRQILDNGCAYRINGDVYFSVDKFPDYGTLSGRKLEDNRAGERVAVDTRKKHPADFALWKVSICGYACKVSYYWLCPVLDFKHIFISFTFTLSPCQKNKKQIQKK